MANLAGKKSSLAQNVYFMESDGDKKNPVVECLNF